MRGWIAAAVLLTAAAPVAATDLAATFASRPAVMQAALSPSGERFVYVGAYGSGGRVVQVVDLASGAARPVMTSVDLSVLPAFCRFKTETRLVCTLWGQINYGKQALSFTRVVAVDTDGKNLKVIGQQRSARGTGTYSGGGVIDWLPDDPDHVLMEVDIGETDTLDTNIIAKAEGRAAAIVDIRTGTRRVVERSSPQNISLGTDQHGEVRFHAVIDYDPSGNVRDSVAYGYRIKGKHDWTALPRGSMTDYTSPMYDGFDETGDHVFQLKQNDGRLALYSVAADGSGTSSLVFAHPKVDIDGVLRIGKYRRPVAATYTVERDERSYFDPKLASLARSLSKALPGQPTVSILDESWDGSKKLIYVDGDNVPGRYLRYDSTTRQLAPLLPAYPQFEGVAMGTVTAVSFAARDGTAIPGYLTLPPGRSDARGLPAIVLPHGGPGARDTAGFDWLAQFFAASGYAVLQPNFRGSTGYGSDFFAKNGFQSWALAIGDVNDGARWLVAQGADPHRLAIVGWSYGGYAALQANVVEPGLYRAAIAIAPVADLPLWKLQFREFTNHGIVDKLVGDGPHLVAGSPAKNAGRIAVPVLLFHADRDQNVDIEQSRVMAGALRGAGKSVQLVEYKGLDHQIDDSEARRDMLAKSAAFLAANLK